MRQTALAKIHGLAIRSVAAALLSASSLWAGAAEPSPTSLDLYRVLLPADAGAHHYAPSDWMYAALTYRGAGLLGYLNLSVNGTWVIHNLPVVAAQDGETESMWYGFSPGPLSPELSTRYGYEIGPQPLEAPPPETRQALAAPKQVFICGMGGGPGGGPKGAGGKAVLEGGPIEGKPHSHQGTFPNQPSEVNQCVSVAFSNSLTWLAGRDAALKLDKNDITPKGLDRIVKRPAGKPVDYKAAIARKKSRFGKQIDTYTLDADQIVRLPDAIDAQCDVEMLTDNPNGKVGHAVTVTGITRHTNGKWSINIVEDTKQGPVTGDAAKDSKTHGTVSETVTWPTGNHQIGGDVGINGYTIAAFVVECPKNTAFSP